MSPLMPAPRKQTQRKVRRKRRGEVFDAAVRVFHAQGYDATSIQDIADEVGILKGSIYYYITSKEDVLFEILDEVHRAALKVVLQSIEADGDPLQKIHAFVTTLARFNAEHLERMGILLHDFRSLSEPRRKEIVRERDEYDRILRMLISQGQDEGIVCPDIDPKLAALAVMGMINTIYQWYRPAGGLRSQYVGAFYADLVIRALACSPDTHTRGHLAEEASLPPTLQAITGTAQAE
jgi:AcrR family transcriptional regulator